MVVVIILFVLNIFLKPTTGMVCQIYLKISEISIDRPPDHSGATLSKPKSFFARTPRTRGPGGTKGGMGQVVIRAMPQKPGDFRLRQFYLLVFRSEKIQMTSIAGGKTTSLRIICDRLHVPGLPCALSRYNLWILKGLLWPYNP